MESDIVGRAQHWGQEEQEGWQAPRNDLEPRKQMEMKYEVRVDPWSFRTVKLRFLKSIGPNLHGVSVLPTIHPQIHFLLFLCEFNLYIKEVTTCKVPSPETFNIY